jgi:hypothetical protein
MHVAQCSMVMLPPSMLTCSFAFVGLLGHFRPSVPISRSELEVGVLRRCFVSVYHHPARINIHRLAT